MFQIGNSIEVKEFDSNWYRAKIVDINENNVKVHFIGWNKRFNKDYQINSSDLRRLTD